MKQAVKLLDVFPNWPVSQEFGLTDFAQAHPGIYRYGIHTGIDLVMPWDTPIRAAHDGIVVKDSDRDNSACGIYVTIWDPVQNIATRYYHMNRNIVVVGQKVKAGDITGYMGNTGLSVGKGGDHPGTHVHFEILRVQLNGYVISWLAYGGAFDPHFFVNWY